MIEKERQRYMQMKQQVLPFDFWEEEKREAVERQQEQADNLPHFETPKNDNEYLLELQWQYKHGDKDALVKMYNHSRQVCLKFINAIGQKNRHVAELTWESKKIKAEDSATYLIERYIKLPDFAITKNFPGYLFLRVVHELYYMRKVDKIVNYVDIQKFFKEGTEGEITETRELVQFLIKEVPESEEDQEQRELKQFYLWKQKNGGKRK